MAALATARCATAGRMAQIRQTAQAYDLESGVTYFNHASVGTTPRVVREARAEYARICERNPWFYTWNEGFTKLAHHARARVADVLRVKPDELAILRSTTEGMNILAQGLGLGPGDEVLFSELNHVGASACFEHWGARLGYAVRRFDFPLQDASTLSADDILRIHLEQIRDHTRVLVFPHIDNMLGLRHPAKRLVQGARQRGVERIIIDGAQSIGMFPVDVSSLGADAYVTCGHKWLQSPKGFGLMHVPAATVEVLEPMMVTWGQVMWAESARRYEDYGTRELASIIALGDAADFQARFNGENAWSTRYDLVEHARARVSASRGLRWRSPTARSLTTSLVAIETVDRQPSSVFATMFEQHGFVFRPFDKLNTIRLSFNVNNTRAQIDRFFDQLNA